MLSDKPENKIRRLRYRKDPAYRSRVQKQRRLRYRKQSGSERNCLTSLQKLKTYAKLRPYMGEDCYLFTVRDLAKALHYNGSTLYRWIKWGWFPPPEITSEHKGNPIKVYSMKQARRIVTIMGEHQKHRSTLTKDCLTTMERLNAAMLP